jgi:hypothetical protein
MTATGFRYFSTITHPKGEHDKRPDTRKNAALYAPYSGAVQVYRKLAQEGAAIIRPSYR